MPAKRFKPPEWIEQEHWQAFIEMRRKIKKPMTDRAKGMLVTCLDNLRNRGVDPNLSLQQSVYHNWQSCYPVKRDFMEAMGLVEPANLPPAISNDDYGEY